MTGMMGKKAARGFSRKDRYGLQQKHGNRKQGQRKHPFPTRAPGGWGLPMAGPVFAYFYVNYYGHAGGEKRIWSKSSIQHHPFPSMQSALSL
jgi:hypothetical protein